jgi:hypothetical protein
MCLLVYGATSTGTGTGAGAGKEKGKEGANKVESTSKVESTKEKEAKERGKGKGVDPKVDFDAPPSLLDLLSMQHRALTASVRTHPHRFGSPSANLTQSQPPTGENRN